MFADNPSLYLYSGGISVAYPAFVAPTALPSDGVWQYDLGSGQWNMAALSGVPVNRSIIGMSAQSSSDPVAYHLGGVKEPASDPYFWTLPSATPYMNQGLLAFEEGSLTFPNYSTSGLNEYGTVGAGLWLSLNPTGRTECLSRLVLFVRRRQNSAHHNTAEMSDQLARFELSDGKDKVFELGATAVLGKPLPRTLDNKGTTGYRNLLGTPIYWNMSLRQVNWTTSIVAIESPHT